MWPLFKFLALMCLPVLCWTDGVPFTTWVLRSSYTHEVVKQYGDKCSFLHFITTLLQTLINFNKIHLYLLMRHNVFVWTYISWHIMRLNITSLTRFDHNSSSQHQMVLLWKWHGRQQVMHIPSVKNWAVPPPVCCICVTMYFVGFDIPIFLLWCIFLWNTLFYLCLHMIAAVEKQSISNFLLKQGNPNKAINPLFRWKMPVTQSKVN